MQGPFFQLFEEKKNLRETQRYPNMDTSYLNTKATNINFFKDFSKSFEKPCEGHCKTIWEKKKKIMRET